MQLIVHGVLAHALLNDISNVFERRSELLELVVAQCDVIGDITLVAGDVEGLLELRLGILVLLLLVEDAALGHDSLG